MLDALNWQPLLLDDAKKLLEPFVDATAIASLKVQGRIAPLPFYKTTKIAWMTAIVTSQTAPLHILLLVRGDEAWLLDGTSGPIHDANDSGDITLDEANVTRYLWFFCSFVYGDEGPFVLVDSPAEELMPGVAVTINGKDQQGRFLLSGSVIYGNSVFKAEFAVAQDGLVEMLSDDALLGQPVPASNWRPPTVCTKLDYARLLAPAMAPGGSNAPLQQMLFELLLIEAWTRKAGHRLISRFNTTATQGNPLQRFVEMLTRTCPVVILESSTPFAEEVVGEIVSSILPRLDIERGTPDQADDTRLRIKVPDDGPALVLIAMHAYRSIVDVARVAYELSTRRVSAIIACDRRGDIPEALRDVGDIDLTLPLLNESLFESFFRRVTGAALPTDWKAKGTQWVPFVQYSDFEHPRDLRLPPAEAFEWARDRVLERLRSVQPSQGLGVKDLHGLGEARQFAEDLITDIQLAISGKIPWTEVDRGALLAGPPGTGKTTLARAIAKDSGVKFVNASAAGWQSAGHLGDHIRAIRADFAAARRFAPAILFLDEIDSIGSRESFSGQNAGYQTEVVNAVLEQIQGMDPAAPVIVIGATNHPERIDPALRRAGRLDRTIEIPYPNSAALAAIFDHYLRTFVPAGNLASDVDTKVLGQMCLRRTGADVEFFVRGAIRRARRAGRPVSQADLLAEVTGKPRDPNALPRMSALELETTSYHEAGHALIRVLGSTRGADITFVTVVPRPDGSLGFVMLASSEKVSLTRAEYIELIELALAGRAAEEIRYGTDGVTTGASSDLERATGMVINMITSVGLGPDGGLLWTSTPSDAHLKAADAELRRIYEQVRAKLTVNRKALDSLASQLMARQELSGPEVVQIISKHVP